MNRKGAILALDIGTSSLKAGLFDAENRLVRSTKVNYDYETSGMSVQIDPEKIWKAFLTVVKRMAGHLGGIDLIVPCTLSPSLIPMDRKGDPLYPAILHWDRRSAGQARKALALIGKDRFLKTAGNLPYPGGISLTSLLWLKDNEPAIFEKTCMFGHMNTLFHKRVTGRWGTDPTHASLMGLYHTVSRGGWIEDLARPMGVPIEKLPPLFPCLQTIGKVTRETASLIGIRSGTPVLMGSNDTSSASLGAGVMENGQILNISGSGELIAVCVDKPFPDEKHYLRAHPLPGRWLLFDLTTGGFALEWFRNQFCREMDEETFYGDYLDELLKEDRKTSVRFLPHLAGDRTSFLQKKASFSGLTLSTTREDCLRAVLEAILDRSANLLHKVSKKIELDRVIHLTGGRANPALLDYKKKRLAGFDLVVKKDCALYGCGEMARRWYHQA
jgi:sugar (pentulose or hexulose) kinase